MRSMLLVLLDLIPMWAQKWTTDDSGGGKYQHHTGEQKIIRQKHGRHRHGIVAAVGVEYGHRCAGDGCRCGIGNVFVPGILEETGLFQTIVKTESYGRETLLWEQLMGVVRWGQVQSTFRVREEDPWRETKELLRAVGVKGW